MRLTAEQPKQNFKGNILVVDNDTAFELINVSKNALRLAVSYGISISAAGDMLNDLDSVEIIIDFLPDALATGNAIGNSSLQKSADSSLNFYIDTNGTSLSDVAVAPRYPSSVAEKVFAGRLMLADMKIPRPKYVSQKISNVSTSLQTLASRNFFTAELEALQVTEAVTSKTSAGNNATVDSLASLSRFGLDLTAPAVEKYDSTVEVATISIPEEYSQSSQQYRQLLKFYLRDVPVSPYEKDYKQYKKVTRVKKLDVHRFTEHLEIPIVNNSSSLNVTFRLFKRGVEVPIEILTSPLDMSGHYLAYSLMSETPIVRPHVQDGIVHVSVGTNDNSTYGYKLYLKQILPNRKVEQYSLLEKTMQQNPAPYFETSFAFEGFGLLRVVPLDIKGNESHLYTTVTLGSMAVDQKPLITPVYYQDDSSISLLFLRQPQNVNKIYLYRRNCSTNVENVFELANEALLGGLTAATGKYEIQDKLRIVPGDIFEYYAVAEMFDLDGMRSFELQSNVVAVKHPIRTFEKKSITVSTSNFMTETTAKGNFVASFDITSQISREENSLITETLKKQLGELYEQFLSPSNNSSSPLAEGKYSELMVHEVTRIDVTSGERVVFNPVGDGKFRDDPEDRSNASIPSLDPMHSYTYHIFSYKKDPMLLFKNYVSRGISVSGKEWFYSPFKWKNTTTNATGVQYADDANGNPIVDGYETLTSEALGLQSIVSYAGLKRNLTVVDPFAVRIDVNTVRISWQCETATKYSESNSYDSFVVMKVVNGIRSFVGRTSKQFIYHELTTDDVGSVHYIIVPLDHDMSIGSYGYSNELIVDTTGLLLNEMTAARTEED